MLGARTQPLCIDGSVEISKAIQKEPLLGPYFAKLLMVTRVPQLNVEFCGERVEQAAEARRRGSERERDYCDRVRRFPN